MNKIAVLWLLSVGLFACDSPKSEDVSLVCKAEAFDHGGPKDSQDLVGVYIRNGTDITFTGAAHFNAPVGLWKAKMCLQSKFSNEKLVYFDNQGCVDNGLAHFQADKGQIVGSYDYLTKVVAIMGAGNFICSTVK